MQGDQKPVQAFRFHPEHLRRPARRRTSTWPGAPLLSRAPGSRAAGHPHIAAAARRPSAIGAWRERRAENSEPGRRGGSRPGHPRRHRSPASPPRASRPRGGTEAPGARRGPRGRGRAARPGRGGAGRAQAGASTPRPGRARSEEGRPAAPGRDARPGGGGGGGRALGPRGSVPRPAARADPRAATPGRAALALPPRPRPRPRPRAACGPGARSSPAAAAPAPAPPGLSRVLRPSVRPSAAAPPSRDVTMQEPRPPGRRAKRRWVLERTAQPGRGRTSGARGRRCSARTPGLGSGSTSPARPRLRSPGPTWARPHLRRGKGPCGRGAPPRAEDPRLPQAEVCARPGALLPWGPPLVGTGAASAPRRSCLSAPRRPPRSFHGRVF